MGSLLTSAQVFISSAYRQICVHYIGTDTLALFFERIESTLAKQIRTLSVLLTGTLLLHSPSPEGSYSWVNYSSRVSRRTESSSEHFASDLSLLKADELWCENKRCSDSNPWPMDTKASVLSTTPQRPILELFLYYYFYIYNLSVSNVIVLRISVCLLLCSMFYVYM